ncbi:MAG: 1-(5-phosphoribosyl)-5-[(5-phosphoribosylamino)methylideneamino]imidazole-4-carboxamide isomerase [Dehalococcoidia bacterium]|nr:1-(5-phosphoribosyl)-5-[(5-phosphoribosylamino)methylideneamino]imidazole-4-carboxamide isomerase [Dehalococcoidia bacterium]
MSFIVIPAIDIKDGKCVRLYQGDFQRVTVFSDDPVETAQRWHQEGAQRLHIVDLDGAASGGPLNLPLLRRIASAVPIPVQVGGGVRSLETVLDLLDAGVDRVILGTAALRDPDMVRAATQDFGDCIAVAVDAQKGFVASHGWQETSQVTVDEHVDSMIELGVSRFIYTAIDRDGTLTEPDYDSIEALVAKTNLPIIASGGIADLGHLLRLKELGAEGAIVGRALYPGRIDLKRAIEDLNECQTRALGLKTPVGARHASPACC